MVVVPPALRAVPAVFVTLVLVFASVKTFELSQLLTISMIFVLHPLYYWGVYRPSLFPVWAAFLAGFVIDLTKSEVLGLNAFLLVFAVLLVERQRRYLLSQPFATQWAGFLLVSLGLELARWVVMTVVNWGLLSPASGLVSGLLSAVLFPVTALVMTGCLRVISPQATERRL